MAQQDPIILSQNAEEVDDDGPVKFPADAQRFFDGESETHVVDMTPQSDDDPGLDLLGPTVIDLPGGVLTMDGRLLRKATVRELTGQDEERLAKADARKPVEYLQTLVEIGLDNIEGQRPDVMMLNNMLLGDRDAIILGMRVATFGDDITYRKLVCPTCDKEFDLDLTVSGDIPVIRLDDPMTDRLFDVPLRRGKVAKVRLATVGDQAAMVDYSQRAVEQNTVLLSRCIVSIGGDDINYQADPAEDIVRAMNMRDRQVILEELRKRQPGPDFDSIEVECPNGCGRKDVLVVTLLDLFRI